MSHLQYRNLAPLEGFTRDLNYTGFIADNLADPLNAVPVVLLLLCLLNGLPFGGGFTAWWVLINTAIIHPMDLIVGTLGRGPKYLSDEYAVMDSRYWPLDDPAVSWISYIEVAVMVPLCFFWYISSPAPNWYRGIVQKKWYRHFCALVASTFQIMGCILYLGCEWHVGFKHLPTDDWPPTLDGYLKLKYFWGMFIGCNFIWIGVPMFVYFCTFYEMQALLGKEKKN